VLDYIRKHLFRLSRGTGERQKEDKAMVLAPLGRKETVRAPTNSEIDALLQAAMAVFAESGSGCSCGNCREGRRWHGTITAHFRSAQNLIVGRFPPRGRRCADADAVWRPSMNPRGAGSWMAAYVDFISANVDLAAALHSRPGINTLPATSKRLRPRSRPLLEAAAASGQSAAVSSHLRTCCERLPALLNARPRRGTIMPAMVDLLIDGLRTAR